MTRARRTLGLAALVLLLALAGACGKETTAPLPVEPPPPQIEEVFPAARATRIVANVQPWVRFREPLDSTTVTAQTVFLKLDTRRIPVRVRLGADRRTIQVEPLELLSLRRTHTLELSPRLRTLAGAELGERYFWQFTTVSVRRIESPGPTSGMLDRGPAQTLSWSGTEQSAGAVEYSIWYGEDSTAVAQETSARAASTRAVLLPPVPWRLGARHYWKAQVNNLETGESETGPVWSFEALPAGTPIDSMLVPIRDSGTWVVSRRTWMCPDLQCGANLGPVMRFALEDLDPELKIAHAKLALRPSTTLTTHNPSVWELSQPWRPCDFIHATVAPVSGYLASGVPDESGAVRFESFVLAAQMQARISGHVEFLDYGMRADRNITFSTGSSPGLWLYFYRPSPRPGS